MTDAGFYRGTNADQDGRFTDKEKKLLKQMKFEDSLERKIDMTKVNLDIIKPWVTMRVSELLGLEDDVVTEYIFTQLEEKQLNPKVMQINITGFLNARRAREFMGELWSLLIEAEESEDGIPPTLVEKKLSEMRKGREERKDNVAVVMAESDWKHRYTTLSGGTYSGPMVKNEKDDRIYRDRERERTPDRRERDKDTNERGRDRPERDRREAAGDTNTTTPPRRKEFDEKEKERQKRREEERKRDQEELERRRKEREKREEERRLEERKRREKAEKERELRKRRGRSRSRSRSKSSSRSRSPAKRRKFREGEKKRPSVSGSDSEEDRKKKKKKKHSSKYASDDSDREARKARKRAKKEKKRKEKERRRSVTPSDTD